MKSQMTIGRRISMLAGLLLAFIVAVGAVSLVATGRMETATQAITGDAMPGVYTINVARSIAKDIHSTMLTHVASDKQDDMAQLESAIAQDQQKLRDTLKEYEKIITRARDRELFNQIGPAFDRFVAAWESPRSLSRAGKSAEALAAFRADTVPRATEFEKAINDEVDYNKTSADEFTQQAASAGSSARFWMWAIVLFAALSGSALAWWIVRDVNRQLGQSVFELSEGAQQLAAAASQVSSSSQALAQGASEQAASLEETSASTEEINSMARKNTENSQAASSEMEKARHQVGEANDRLAQMVSSMKEITDSSGKISKIIKVIDEIAFQTNILALNAAVEAARAGEAGMGFAVVADEVRNLAQRCAQAAKDTASLIEESIEKSTTGGKHLHLVAEGIAAITTSAAQVKTLVDEVSLGSQEQARGIDQIGKAVAQMEQVTQKTAANAEESAAAAEELNAQSAALKGVVERLSAMVGGDSSVNGSGHRGASVKRGASGHHAVSHRGRESAAGLSALHAAVAHKSEPVAIAAKIDKSALPLEEEFKEF